jgi:D-aminopeptidase
MTRQGRNWRSAMLCFVVLMIGATPGSSQPATEARVRARDIGIKPGVLPPGSLNAITDVAGVRVGQVTLRSGPDIRTGVTAIVPHASNIFQQKVPAAIYVGNGFGKLIGSTQVEELGVLETPIVLTNTLSVWRAGEALADYILRQPGNASVRSVNVVVGETNDGDLNDIRGMHVEKHDVIDALESAKTGSVEEGSVGAGTGTIAFGFKGGIGTASRLAAAGGSKYTVGALVQTNFGGVLTIDGLPVGKDLGKHLFSGDSGNGSVMIVVATDAPLDARQLKRVATRAMLGVARTGSPAAHGSGDYAIAFSTAESMRSQFGSATLTTRPFFPEDQLTAIFEATVEATEEAIYNSLLKATTTTGRDGRTVEALPIQAVKDLIQKYHYSPK